MTQILFIANACTWRDKVNGNTYHSVRITRCSDGEELLVPYQYGYGEHYRQSSREAMLKAGWLPNTYNKDNAYLYERENDYPILWNVSDGLKRDCVSNGSL